jgi:release factor-specific protein-(glutamine-N5) methyltransferase
MNNAPILDNSADLLRFMTVELAGTGIYPHREAQNIAVMIISQYSGLSLAEILLNKLIDKAVEHRIMQDFDLVMKEYPVQYVLGKTEFCGRLFSVDSNVLIPRPETEELVQLIIDDFDISQQINILDIGTGSGCIAISLQCNFAAAKVYATDISENALKVAQQNNIRHNTGVVFVNHDIMTDAPSTLPSRFDLIVSNPPYVCRSEMKYMKNNVLQHEPHTALFVDDSSPLTFYAAILRFASVRLANGGFIYTEINENLGKETLHLFENNGYKAELIKDMSGKNRFIKAQKIDVTAKYVWGDGRRFNSYAGYFRRLFGQRVQKLTVDAGFTCPNRDGSLGRGGCTYCDNNSFNPSYCEPSKPIVQQIEEGIEFHTRRYRRAHKFLAYFQAYSNTYAPIEQLRRLYNEALVHPEIVGLVIGTRPDCVDEEKLDMLAELSEKHYIAIEYGVESCYDATLKRINRLHNFECSQQAIESTAARGIKTGIHLIFGLPGETKQQMLDEIDLISQLPVHSVKFHQLQLLKNTQITREYTEKPEDFHLFDVEEYIDFMTDVVERLRPDIIIERIAGEAPPKYLAVPTWRSLRNDSLLAMFEQNLEKRNTYQGKRFNQ